MIERPSDLSTRYTNPNSVPKGPRNIITATDPRNNAMYLLLNPDTIVVDEESLPNQPIDNENSLENNFYIEEFSPQYDDYSGSPDDLVASGQPILDVPQNLLISAENFSVENADSVNGDGTINYLTTLSFDDVVGASGYEYVINAVN
jgi:hypothetical protein